MKPQSLTALSPLDGRYAARLRDLAELSSEAGLIRKRVTVEIAWFKALASHPDFTALPELHPDDQRFLDQLVDQFSDQDAAAIKAIEKETNHDVKAVEYWLKTAIGKRPGLAPHLEFVHFALTSEDINNLSWALIIQAAIRDVLDPLLSRLDHQLQSLALETADLPMLSRTHGQTASPTTLGKEVANVVFRLRRQRRALSQIELTGKINGAVGNFNAHLAASPDIDWPELSRRVVEDLGLIYNPYTTQIEPHDMVAEVSHALIRINTILIDFSRDSWAYISLGYFRQKLVDGEVGSSTMPHKVNPIDFENGEGNLGLANSLLEHMALKLPISRWQRDLTDSTVQRSLGSAFAYCSLAWQSILRGLERIAPNPERISADLDQAWEVLAEPVQTVMRLHKVPEPYEKLKALTRGHGIDRERLHTFIHSLEIPSEDRDRLLAMTPSSYIGLAAQLARDITRYV